MATLFGGRRKPKVISRREREDDGDEDGDQGMLKTHASSPLNPRNSAAFPNTHLLLLHGCFGRALTVLSFSHLVCAQNG